MGQLIALREASSIPVELLIPRQPLAAASNPHGKAVAAKTIRKVLKKAAARPMAKRVSERQDRTKPRAKVARKK